MAAVAPKLTADDLMTLQITRVIFHDVPHRPRNAEVKPGLSDVETDISGPKIVHVRDRLKIALGSPRAYPIQFVANSSSPVPALIREATAAVLTSEQFVALSQKIALYLFEHHSGVTSPGLLAVMDCVVQAEQALAILKLERKGGARLEPTARGGKRTYDLSVFDDLVLTQDTRFFKNALFHRTGPEDDDFAALACDDQSDQIASFWSRFLGCSLIELPRIATQKFFEASMNYISNGVADPVEKTAIYEAVLSELNSNKKHFAPKKFITDHVPVKHQKAFQDFLVEQKVSLAQFTVDTSEIKTKLARKSYITNDGAVVTAPADKPELLTIEKTRIIVNDTVKKVDHK